MKLEFVSVFGNGGKTGWV